MDTPTSERDVFCTIRQSQARRLDNFLQRNNIPWMNCPHISHNATMFFSKLSFQCSSNYYQMWVLWVPLYALQIVIVLDNSFFLFICFHRAWAHQSHICYGSFWRLTVEINQETCCHYSCSSSAHAAMDTYSLKWEEKYRAIMSFFVCLTLGHCQDLGLYSNVRMVH